MDKTSPKSNKAVVNLKFINLKFQYFANTVCSIHALKLSATIYAMSEVHFCSCNLDMGISQTPVFLPESVLYNITDFRFN